jgi:hypothetical protein
MIRTGGIVMAGQHDKLRKIQPRNVGLTGPIKSINISDEKNSEEQSPSLPCLQMGVDSFHPSDSGGLAAGEDDLGVTLGGIGERFLFLIFLVIAVGLMIVIVTLIVMVEVGRARRAGLSVWLEQAAEPIHVWAEVWVSLVVTVEVLLSLRRIGGKALVGV